MQSGDSTRQPCFWRSQGAPVSRLGSDLKTRLRSSGGWSRVASQETNPLLDGRLFAGRCSTEPPRAGAPNQIRDVLALPLRGPAAHPTSAATRSRRRGRRRPPASHFRPTPRHSYFRESTSGPPQPGECLAGRSEVRSEIGKSWRHRRRFSRGNRFWPARGANFGPNLECAWGVCLMRRPSITTDAP